MPRFCIISNDLYTVSNLRGDLLHALAEQGWEIHILVPNRTDYPAIEAAFVAQQFYIHDYALQKSGTHPWHELKTIQSLYRQLKHIQPNRVLSYTIKPAMYGTLAAYYAGVPARYILLSGLGFAFQSQHRGAFKYIKYAFDRVFAYALTKATRVIFQNSDDLALIQQLGLLKNTPTGVVNGSGVNLDRFKRMPLIENAQQQPASIFVMVARLLKDKGIYEYIQAIQQIKSRHPEAVFHLVGWIDDNPEAISKHVLDEWIAAGLIEYWGRVDDVRPIIAKANVMVLPSYREGTPRSVLEAMAMGRAVITTDAPGCRETIVDGKNGYQVKVASVTALTDAMQKIIDTPSDLRFMSDFSYDMVCQRYDVHKVNQEMIDLMSN